MRKDCIYSIRQFNMKEMFVVSPDVWKVIIKDLNQNPESIKAVFSNMKEQDMIFMLSEAIRAVKESGSSAYEALMICFQEKLLELEHVFRDTGP